MVVYVVNCVVEELNLELQRILRIDSWIVVFKFYVLFYNVYFKIG